MNTTSQFVFNPKLIFAVVAGLIVLSMIMGRKQRDSHRSHFGWWIGLGVLLAVASGFLGYSKLSVSPIVEERRSQRSAFNQAMAEMKEQIAAGVEAARDSVKEGLDDMNKNVEEAQQSLTSVVKESKSTNRAKRSGTNTGKVTSSSPAPPAVPATTVQWTAEVKDRERSQQQQVVEERLRQKATAWVNRWVNERMPIKTYAMQVVAAQWLKDNGAFPEPITFTPEEMPRANTDQKDKLFGGSLTVVLPPNMQQTLLDLGYQELEQVLQSDKLTTQFVMFCIVMGITGFVGLLGMVKMVVTRRVALFSQSTAST